MKKELPQVPRIEGGSDKHLDHALDRLECLPPPCHAIAGCRNPLQLVVRSLATFLTEGQEMSREKDVAHAANQCKTKRSTHTAH